MHTATIIDFPALLRASIERKKQDLQRHAVIHLPGPIHPPRSGWMAYDCRICGYHCTSPANMCDCHGDE